MTSTNQERSMWLGIKKKKKNLACEVKEIMINCLRKRNKSNHPCFKGLKLYLEYIFVLLISMFWKTVIFLLLIEIYFDQERKKNKAYWFIF